MTEPTESNDPPDEQGTVGEPELRRVSVIGGRTQVDLGLPAAVPVAVFIGDVVALLESRTPPAPDREDAEPPAAQRWTLARLGRPAIRPDETLADAEVLDGDLLTLRPLTEKEAPALFDDLIDAAARLTRSAFRSWSDDSARAAGLIVALVAVPLAVVLLVVSEAQLGSGAIAASAGAGTLGAAVIIARRYSMPAVVVVLALCGLVLLGSGVALLVPGGIGWPHALLACAVIVSTAAAVHRFTGIGATLTAAAITTGTFAGVVAAVSTVWQLAPAQVAAATVAVALTAITPTAQLARMAAKLPVPPVPTAGGAIDPADHEPRPTIEGIGAIGATMLPSAAGLADRAKAANRYQSGMIIGVTIAAAAGAFVAADPLGSPRWQGVALAGIVGLILCLRGRAYADLTQAGTLMGGGASVLLTVLFALGLGAGDRLIPAACGLLVLATVAVFLGVAGPSTDISPITRRAGELFEYGMIIAVVPLVVWIMDLYSVARNI
ncbi:type VII secretion integral membrane protein EccD [Nocardia sp. NPDC052566]|uniref:type VII secretion integral membrane protein EccD n=1 Tax=Nocardia sp. NPDC052566 TaxID=3364330 RepID=UPI0037C85C40